ncbi:hypothetical protein R5R35_001396 [Gryllus longicercus]|uniref:Neuroparsin n=1 Tax=Gryllus longicercus TaxID=2509291 RepID=A0AAN9VNX5_9ORTH
MTGDSTRFTLLGVLLALTVGTVVALVCEPPRDAEFCMRIRIKCLQFSEENCTASDGVFIERGGLCNYCNLCARYVGAGEVCNTTVVEHGSVEGGVGVWSVCSHPLVCSRRSNGTCVRSEECEYPSTDSTTEGVAV